ncbi:hypothetical protein A9Q99_24320 [Gammaproteobacteria bacterium 45_16_T64]|nr:hypothetical protein A9Q99_24320 [Gammaproteobacteria bacterium 45_16_T64]
MRILTDITGKELRLNKIEGVDALAGILEGSPYMIRKMRVFSAKKYMNGAGQFFSGIELLEKEVETLKRDCDQLPLRELWLAEISTGNKFNDGKFSTNRLNVQWYQE